MTTREGPGGGGGRRVLPSTWRRALPFFLGLAACGNLNLLFFAKDLLITSVFQRRSLAANSIVALIPSITSGSKGQRDLVVDGNDNDEHWVNPYNRPDIVLHTPEKVLKGELDSYVSLPVLDDNVTYADIQARVKRALARPVKQPNGFLYKGNPPGRDVVMGLASYPTAMTVFRKLVGSLRQTGYDGHIILGVHPNIPSEEQEYLKKMDVTYYATEVVDCANTDNNKGDMFVRSKCAKTIENLTLEKGRFEMARQWLHACKECTGWALMMDTRDAFFQADPFVSLPPPNASPYDLLFIEEFAAPYSQPNFSNPRDKGTVDEGFYRYSPCYGGAFHKKYPSRAILCSGTIIGNRHGMDRFLAVYVDEFLKNSLSTKEGCRSPENMDQGILQYMYYSGYFGDVERTRTSPWGAGPVNTIGYPCAREKERNFTDHHAPLLLTRFDNKTGLILNNNLPDGHPARIAPVVHQFDRCWDWIHNFFGEHDKQLFYGGSNTPVDKIKPVPWLKNKLTS